MSSPIIIFLLIAAVIGIPIYLKKKKNKAKKALASNRRNKDEVWKTIKQFLKEEGSRGTSIFESYVAKRNNADYIIPTLSKIERKKKKEEIKIRKWQEKQVKNNVKPVIRDLYVVCFTQENPKTHELFKPRCIQCEVLNVKIGKKDYDRRIAIDGELDYDTEMEWIAPMKYAEELKMRKANQMKEKQEQKAALKAQKNANKERNKYAK